MDNNKFPPITKPEDYQLMYHSNTDGHIWVDAQGRLIPLTQQLTYKPNPRSTRVSS